MLATRRQPLHSPYLPSPDYDTTQISRSSSISSFFDNIDTSSELIRTASQNYLSPSPEYSAAGFLTQPNAFAVDYMSSGFDFNGPAIRIQQSTPTPQQIFGGYPQQSVLVDGAQNTNAWVFGEGQMLTGSSLQTPALNRRNRSHQRIPSSSSAGSTSPASPFQGHAPQLMFGNATQSPLISKLESSFPADEASRSYANHLPTPTQTPTQDSFLASTPTSFNPPFQHIDSTVAAHMAMKHAFADGTSVTEEDAPGFSHSTRHSVSSFGRNSPATPRTLNGDDFDEGIRVPQNGETNQKVEDWIDQYLRFDDGPDTIMRSNNQAPKLEHTMTDIYTDDLFPPQTSQPPSQKPSNLTLLSPYHNRMMTERLQQANQARSQSPTSASSTRAISPFRQASPYSQPGNRFESSQPRFATAQQAREQQKAQAEINAFSRPSMMHQQSSEPKTISPKDAVLEYHETEEDSKMPLFPEDDSNYAAYSGGNYQNVASAVASDVGSYGNMAVSGAVNGWSNPAGQSSAPYSATSTVPPQSQFSFAPSSVPGQFHGLSTNNYSSTGNMAEATPEFPAHLTSMESSVSEAPPQSSSNSNHADIMSKPSSTLADSGTYTCTYHGCTQRFETPQKLQRHKREAHRQNVQQQQPSPQPHPVHPGVGSGMTSAALAARNSQAGPHKCDRINPTTGKSCNTVFSRPYDLTRHEDTIHNARKQKVRCALCQEEKTFSRNDALTRHMRVVHPDVDFPGKHRRRGGRGESD